MTKPSLLLLALMLAILSACSTGLYYPRQSNVVQTEARFAIIRTDSLLVAIRPQAYPNSSNTFAQRFFSVAVHVRNLSSSVKKINPSSFSILAGGRQYDYIPLDLILGDLRNYDLLSRNELFSDFSAFHPVDDKIDRQQEFALELINSYFSFGDLLPGGRKEGYLFYNRDVRGAKSIEVDALGQRLIFDYRK